MEAMDAERFEGNDGLATGLGFTAVFLWGMIAFVAVQAAPQFSGFSPAAVACAFYWIASFGAAGLFLLRSAAELGASFVVDDEGITRLSWAGKTFLAWREIERLEESHAIWPKGEVGRSGRCVLFGPDGRRIVIPLPSGSDGERLRGRLEPHLVSVRAAEFGALARHGGRFRPYRTTGFVVLAAIAPLCLVAGWAAFDPAGPGRGQPDAVLALIGYFSLAAATVLAMLGVELISREFTVTPDGLAVRSLILNRSIPFDWIASIAVEMTESEEVFTEHATIRGDGGQTIEFDSSMPGYRAVLDLVRLRAGANAGVTAVDDREFS
jgi:hypothetical protein